MYIQAIELNEFSYLRDQASVFDAQSYVGYSIAPDGFPADKTLLYNPQGLWCNSMGDLYYAETGACSIRMINKTTQTVKTIGGYSYCVTDSSIPTPDISATSWSFPPTASQITGDSAGNLYVSAKASNIVLKISASTNKVSRYAGSGNGVSSAVDIDPLSADLLSPSGVAATPWGTLYIADSDPQTNIGRITFILDGNPTIKRFIILPTSNSITSIYFELDFVYFTTYDGGIYYVDTTAQPPFVIDTISTPMDSAFRSIYSYSLNYMYLVDASVIPTVKFLMNYASPVDQIGGGSQYEGLARNIQLENPYGLTGDGNGNIYVSQESFISTYNSETGLVNVSVGVPSSQRSERQDNIPASLAIIGLPDGLTGDTSGNIYLHDGLFRKVSAVPPHPMTVVSDLNVDTILDLKYDRNRHGLVFLTDDGQIRNISINSGVVHRIGTQSNSPKRLWVDSNSDIFFITSFAEKLVKKYISQTTGSVIIAGSTTSTLAGNGGPALAAKFTSLDDIWGNSVGDLFVIDNVMSIRKIFYNSITSTLFVDKITITNFNDAMYFLTGDQFGNLYFTNGEQGVVSVAIPTTGLTYDYRQIAGVGFANPPQPTDGPGDSIIMYPERIWVSSVGNIFVSDYIYKLIREFHVRTPTSSPSPTPTISPSSPPTFRQTNPTSQPTTQPSSQPTSIPTSLITASTIIRNYVGREEIENYTPLNQTTFSEITNIWGDTLGNLYLADHGACSIRKVPVNENYVSTVVGIRKCDSTTPWSYSDLRASIIATKRALPPMWGITGDTNGNIYYSLPLNYAIMIYYPSTLITTMFIGAASPGDAGGPNIGAQTAGPMGLMMNSQSCLFFADSFSQAIRYSCANNNQVATLIDHLGDTPAAVYRVGSAIYFTLTTDGTLHYESQMTTTIFPNQDMFGVWVDSGGNLYATSNSAGLVYFHDYQDGISTSGSPIAGGGSVTLTFAPMNNPLAVDLNSPIGLWGDSLNRLYVADLTRVLMIDLPEATIQTFIGDAGSTLTYIRSDRAVYTEPIPTFWVDRNRVLYFQDQTTTLESIKMVSPINQEITPITSSLGNSVVCIQGDSINRLFVLRSDYIDLWIVDLTTKATAVIYSDAYNPMSFIFYDDFYPNKDRLFMIMNYQFIYVFNLTTGNIEPIAGATSSSSSPVDDEIALASIFDQIKDIWADSLSSIYAIDVNYVRKVYIDPTDNTRYRVKLIAGLGSTVVTPRLLNLRATLADLLAPVSITGDTIGNIYISDSFTRYIYYLSPSKNDASYRINVFAGTGEKLLALDHTQSLAHETAINPGKLVMHQGSNRLYVHDTGLNIIREILPSFRHTSLPSSQPTTQPSSQPSSRPTSEPSTQPSTQPTTMPSVRDYSYLFMNEAIGRLPYEDGRLMNDTEVKFPSSPWMDSNGHLYYVEDAICSIRKVDAFTSRVTTIAGNKICIPGGSLVYQTIRGNVPARSISLSQISGLYGRTTSSGLELFFSLLTRRVVMIYTAVTDTMTVLAGTGVNGNVDGAAFVAQFRRPSGLWIDSTGNLILVDYSAAKIRKISFNPTIVSTIATTGSALPFHITGNNSDFVYISSGQGLFTGSLHGTVNIKAWGTIPSCFYSWLHRDGFVYVVSLAGYGRVWKVSPNGQYHIIAGSNDSTSTSLIPSQEIPANSVNFTKLTGVISDKTGNYLLITKENQIVKYNLLNQMISNHVGFMTIGNGDNQKALEAILNGPIDITGNDNGDLFILEYPQSNIRFINHSTNIITSISILFHSIDNNLFQIDHYNSFYFLESGRIVRYFFEDGNSEV